MFLQAVESSWVGTLKCWVIVRLKNVCEKQRHEYLVSSVSYRSAIDVLRKYKNVVSKAVEEILRDYGTLIEVKR